MKISTEKLQEAKMKLGLATADRIADILQLENYNSTRHISSCPSPSHRDSTPSFSFDSHKLKYHCFGCGITVDIIDAYMMTGMTYLEAAEKLFEEVKMPANFAERGAKSNRQYRYPEPKHAETKENVYDYWGKRCISQKTIDYLGIMEDPEGNTLFEYYDDNDVLVSVKVRPSRPIRNKETKCWWLKDKDGNSYDTKHILFNRNKINPDQPLIITSGEGDCASCIECGIMNATSIPMGDGNTQWIGEEWEFINAFESIILVHDNDKAGEKLADEVRRRLGEYRVKICELPTVYVNEDGEKFKVKDLNEVLFYFGKETVVDCINNARDSEIPSIVDYTDVPKFDMSDVDGFETGFKDMDAALGKFYVGTTTVLTGITGSGKSSMLSTLICKAVEQDFSTFVYSGELSNPALKNWVDCVHAGQRGINEYRNGNSTYYKIRPDVYQSINEQYKGKLFFYKDGFNHKVSSLLATMESVVRKHGVRFLVLDNLSSMDLENDDNNKWNRMDDFIRNVIEFSKRWQVVVVLVLHPKKMDFVRRMTVFDLQGVASAANLSHRVISLYRVPAKEKQGEQNRRGDWIKEPCSADVILDVLKDRFGSAGGKEIKLWYDVPSRRFYDSLENLDHKYEWDKNDYSGLPLPYPPMDAADIPFMRERSEYQ